MAKKLKGLAKIELTDVKTGETKVQYEENIVTNAIPNIYGTNPFGACFVHSSPAELMGGLLLYKDPLVEDVNNTTIPKTPDAWAGNGVSKGLSTKRGNAVLQESVITSNGCKFVWEFNTAQGNGQYSTLCLTNPYICNNDIFGLVSDPDEKPMFVGGYQPLTGYESTFHGIGIEVPKNATVSTGALTSARPNFIDSQNGYHYYISYNTSSTKTFTLHRCTRKVNSIPIGQSNNGDDTNVENMSRKGVFYYDLISVDITLTNALSTNTSSKVSSVHFTDDGSKMYIFTLTSNTNTIYQTTVDLTTFTANGVDVTEKVLTYNDVKYWIARSTNSDYRYSLNTNKVGFKYPYIYLPTYADNNLIYKLNINDTTDVKTLNGTANLLSNYSSATNGDTLVLGNFIISPEFYIIDTVSDTVTAGPPAYACTYRMSSANTSALTPPITMGDKYIINKWSYNVQTTYRFHENGSCYGYSLFLNPFYLATINNVTPFEKTSAQIMRITYTISEVDT